MPGIITHNKVFIESINYLTKAEYRNVFNKSIKSLFKSESFKKAGLFGAIGPNIFNYLPIKTNNYISGSEISYELHSARSENFLKSMLSTILSYQDKNNEWASIQRAYLYGVISHLISDSIFHPFIYYWSGLPSSKNKKDLSYFREQHLLFEYNMDLYFNTSYNGIGYNNNSIFNIDDMLPITYHNKFQRVERAIKDFLIDTIEEVYPDFLKKLIFIKNKKYKRSLFSLTIDIIPIFIKLSYKIKKIRNPRFIKITNYLKRKNYFYSDYFINYPPAGRINTHVLNLHKERWFHPIGISGFHYESVQDLLLISCKQIINIWQKIEKMLYKNQKNSKEIEDELKIESFTGTWGKDFYSMYIQNPVRLRF